MTLPTLIVGILFSTAFILAACVVCPAQQEEIDQADYLAEKKGDS